MGSAGETVGLKESIEPVEARNPGIASSWVLFVEYVGRWVAWLLETDLSCLAEFHVRPELPRQIIRTIPGMTTPDALRSILHPIGANGACRFSGAAASELGGGQSGDATDISPRQLGALLECLWVPKRGTPPQEITIRPQLCVGSPLFIQTSDTPSRHCSSTG